MSKCLAAILTILVWGVNGTLLAAPTQTQEPQVTQAEAREARDVATQFTVRFVQTRDLAPIVKDLFWSDFIERYKESNQSVLEGKPANLLLVSGLDYNSRLLREGNSEDWQRFYVAANNFLLLGFLSGLKHYSGEKSDIKATDLYPASVIKLLDQNPNLANMIVRKGSGKAVGSVEEMRSATATLEQAVTAIRNADRESLRAGIEGKLAKVIKEDEFFAPRVDVMDQHFFGFPKDTRIISIKTPLGLVLYLARDGERLKIFSTEIITE